jgi:hypothetical protein
MKRLYFLLFCALIGVQVFAQDKWADSWCNQWNVLSYAWDPSEEDEMYGANTVIYELGADTLINDLAYQKLTGYYSGFSPAYKSYVAALRFAGDKKVFIHYQGSEYLLYDFDVQVGDTLEIFGGIRYFEHFNTLPHVITAIDTLSNGLLIKSRVTLTDPIGSQYKFTKTWIEGVGSIDGIIHNTATYALGNALQVLLCAYHDDSRLYTVNDSFHGSLGCVYNNGIFSATEEVESPTPSAQKIMQNGQLLILHEGKTYNVMGVEVGQ